MARKTDHAAKSKPRARSEPRRWSAFRARTRGLLVAQGTWRDQDAPLLDAYVEALRAAEFHRQEATAAPYGKSGARVYAHPGWSLARDAEREARVLAAELVLTPASRRAHGIAAGRLGDNPFARLAVVSGDE